MSKLARHVRERARKKRAGEKGERVQIKTVCGKAWGYKTA